MPIITTFSLSLFIYSFNSDFNFVHGSVFPVANFVLVCSIKKKRKNYRLSWPQDGSVHPVAAGPPPGSCGPLLLFLAGLAQTHILCIHRAEIRSRCRVYCEICGSMTQTRLSSLLRAEDIQRSLMHPHSASLHLCSHVSTVAACQPFPAAYYNHRRAIYNSHRALQWPHFH